MARKFLLKSKTPNMTVKQLLDRFGGKYKYIYDEPFNGLQENEIMQMDSKIPFIQIGDKNTVFGFTLQFDNEQNCYTVRIGTLVGLNDLNCMINFLNGWQDLFDGEITNPDGTVLSNFYMNNHILDGLLYMKKGFDEYDMEVLYLGTRNELTLHRDELDKILNSLNPVNTFNNFLKEKTKYNKYRTKQSFKEIEKYLISIQYDLRKGKTLLEISPVVESRNRQYVNETGIINNWNLVIENKEVDYIFALNNLDGTFLDRDNFLADGDYRATVEKYAEKIKFDNEHFDTYIDYYVNHYKKIIENEYPLGQLNAVTHMAFILRFMIDNDMVSPYIEKYYPHLDKFNLEEFIRYSFQGFLPTYFFNDKGLKFLRKNYGKYMQKLNKIEKKGYLFIDEKKYPLVQKYLESLL